MRSRIWLPLLLAATGIFAPAFCGFYVARVDTKLINKGSQVIIARNGEQTVVTMSSDFSGDVRDFAMVIPVPEVLKRDQIRLADAAIFDKLDAYSGPRLVEYHDQNPCQQVYLEEVAVVASRTRKFKSVPQMEDLKDVDLGVQIEATYEVGEYDILILSATESSGLETWLTRNGYKIPAQAAEILRPYVTDGLKFFVVKVNLERLENADNQKLSPIQMSFNSTRFMLPIRLGMANSDGEQDMVIYALSSGGRIEPVNYRMAQVPSNFNIPEFVQNDFTRFYGAVLETKWKKDGKAQLLLEYAWDLSSGNFVKCDPCATTPPAYTDLREAGAFWLKHSRPTGWQGSDYEGDVFFTRLHVRYGRKDFPQDLVFQETSNRESFQGRYVMNHPAQGDLSCPEAQDYLKNLVSRRKEELNNLNLYTGWDISGHGDYISKYQRMINGGNKWIEPLPKEKQDEKPSKAGDGTKSQGFIAPESPELQREGIAQAAVASQKARASARDSLRLTAVLLGIGAIAVLYRRRKEAQG